VIVYRVFPYDEGAAPTDRGGALFVPPSSGLGRIDNPDLYDVLYVARTADAAVAEVFGRLALWRPQTFVHGSGWPYALAAYNLPDDRRTFNLNDVDALRSIGVTRPSDVVTRDRTKTQSWAATVFAMKRYVGAEWWSYYNPDWPVLGLWDRSDLAAIGPPEIISATSPTVQRAAESIVRQITI
jgi:hypothetical protein